MSKKTQTEQMKEAYGENFSQVDLTEDDNKLITESSEVKELSEIKPELPQTQKRVKFSKGRK